MPNITCPYCGFADLAANEAQCPQCQTELQSERAPPGTRLQAIAGVRSRTSLRRKPTRKEPLKEAYEQRPFRPLLRPPMAVVTILDDDQESGEEIRIREGRITIGRNGCDINISHDEQVSGQHAEICRVLDQGEYRWHVRDLNSTNGTFARVDEAPLRSGQELLLGSRRYRFDSASQGSSSRKKASQQGPKPTQVWGAGEQSSSAALMPSLIELSPTGEGDRLALSGPDQFIGGDPQQCSVVFKDDPFAGRKHARLYRDKRGRWMIEPGDADCEIWVRVNAIEVISSGQFQIGEQRFSVRVP